MQLLRALSPRQRTTLRRDIWRSGSRSPVSSRIYYLAASALMVRALRPDCAPSTRALLIREARDTFACAVIARQWERVSRVPF